MRAATFSISTLSLTGALAAFAMFDIAGATSAPTAEFVKVTAKPGVITERSDAVRLIEDYGSFALYKVASSRLASLPADVQVDRDADVLQFSAYPVDTRRSASVAAPSAAVAGLQIVQFVGPIKQAWLDELSTLGIKPVQYVAKNGYIVWADGAAAARLEQLRVAASWLQYSAPFNSVLKVDGLLGARVARAKQDDETDVVVQIYRHDGDDETRAFVEGKAILSASQLGPSGKFNATWAPVLAFANLTLRVRLADIPAIASRADVTYVGEYHMPRMFDEKQGIIMAGDFAPGPLSPSYLQFLIDSGFSQNPNDYPVVDITDSTIDEGGTGGAGHTVLNTADSMLHVLGNPALPARVAYFNNCTGFASDFVGAVDGHGSLNAGIVADYDQRSGYPFQDNDGQHLGLGINPFGRVGSTTIFLPQYSIAGCGGTDQGVILSNWQTGAKISSNSWGASIGSLYDASAQAYDAGVRDADPSSGGNQEMIYLFAAGNDGPSANSIGSPGSAKNVITVGASENARPFATPADNHCGADAANNPQNVVDFSSRGPAQGGRVKPEVLAPGTHVQAGASTYSGYDGSGVCVRYFPESPAQQIFTYSSGTSHSTPAVAGVASLAYWWIEHGGAGAAAQSLTEIGGSRAPSPAMMKAWLIAHPSYLTGVDANDDLPSTTQGYGMPNMHAMFDTTRKVLVDQSDVFDNTGETRSYTFGVGDTGKPLRIALAYTDAPGALGAGTLVNDLDLVVEANGKIYRGNSFAHQWSSSGGISDSVNNYEAVFLPPGTTGDITITVSAANIAGDGVPNVGDQTDQDFALVCSNCVLAPTFTVTSDQRSPSVCVGANLATPVSIDSILDYSTDVNLQLSGGPAGVVANVVPGTVTPPAFATLSVKNSAAVAVGHYPLLLTASSGSIVKTLDFDLSYASLVPKDALLDAPANDAANVDVHPLLSWNAASQASTYLVEVATDTAFHDIVASAEVTDTVWPVTPALNSNTRYYWRVRAKNGCGESGGDSGGDRLFAGDFESSSASTSSTTTVFAFTTAAELGDCPLGSSKQTLFADDMESGAPGWAGGGDANGVHWHVGGTAHGGTHAFIADHDPFLAMQQDLHSPNIDVPANLSNITLSFFNQQSMTGIPGGACFQGALLAVSTDGGVTSTQVITGLLTDPYDGPISASGSNPLAGHPGWCGNPQSYLNSIVDLSQYAGQSIRLIFKFADDTFDDSTGRPPNPAWAIDDVKVTGCIAH